MAGFNVDSIIEQLLAVKGKPAGTRVKLPVEHIKELCARAGDLFLAEPSLIETKAPLTIIGNTMGHYSDLLRWFDQEGYPTADDTFLFLGNYVDRGDRSIETICLVLAYKIKFPTKVILLRGNHEALEINKIYGLLDECKALYTEELLDTFVKCFDCLPIAALVNDKIFCVHGGLSPDLDSFDQIRAIQRPCQVAKEGMMTDLLWSDPDKEREGWNESPRGCSFTFGEDIIKEFTSKHNIDLIVRSHMLVNAGFEYAGDKKCLTIFSSSNYCGSCNNDAAILKLDDKLNSSLKIIKPIEQ